MAPTTLLLLCLLAATVLGAGIGACLWHLRLIARHRRAFAALSESGARERRALDAMLAQERERSDARHAEARRQLARERGRAERIIARHDALAARAGEQGRRAERLRAEASGLEARCMKLQRDLASERAGRRRGRAAPRPEPTRRDGEPADAREASPHALDPREIDRLPVLNRRVGTRAAPDGPAAPASPIGTDPEISTPAESERPGAGDGPVPDLADAGRPSRDADGR